MDLFLNTINYCRRMIEYYTRIKDDDMVELWKLELKKWNQHFRKFYNTTQNPFKLV